MRGFVVRFKSTGCYHPTTKSRRVPRDEFGNVKSIDFARVYTTKRVANGVRFGETRYLNFRHKTNYALDELYDLVPVEFKVEEIL